MKLCACHIENFGKLCDFHLEFQEEYTALCCENGWGKSTLAAFIRVMFYGFEGEKKRKERNERNFYRPWQGGVYGGWLVFETEGKVYRITRAFGKKESEDVFELRNEKTNTESRDYTGAVGRELFGIDSESFMRTVFIGQNDCATKATGDINAKMGNLTDNTEDLTDYETADESLKMLLNRMSPRRKTGELHQLRAQITVLETAIKTEPAIEKNLRGLQQKIGEKTKELETIRQSRQELEKRQKRAAALKEAQTIRESYKELQRRCEEAEGEVQKARSVFPGELPEKETVERWQRVCGEMEKVRTAAQSHKLKAAEEERLQETEQIFASQIPSEEDLEQCKMQIHRLEMMRQKASEHQMTEKERHDLEAYRLQFGAEEKPSRQLDVLQKKWEKRVQKKAASEVRQKSLEEAKLQEKRRQEQWEQEEKQSRDKQRLIKMAGIILSVILMAAAGASCVIAGGFSIWSSGFLAACAVVLCLMVWQLRVSGKEIRGKQIKELEKEQAEGLGKEAEELERERADISRIDTEIAAYLRKRGTEPAEDQVSLQLQEWMKSAVRYEDLLEKEKREAENSHEKECRELAEKIEAFLGQYGEMGILPSGKIAYMERFLHLENSLREWKRLKAQKETVQKEQKSYKSLRSEMEEEICGIGFEPSENLGGQILKFREMLQRVEQKEQILRAEQSRRAEFAQKNGLSDPDNKTVEMPGALPENLEVLNAENQKLIDTAEEIQNVLRSYGKQLEELRRESDTIAEQKEELEAQKQKEAKESKKYVLLSRTKDLLEEAKETLTARYIQPLKTRYDFYVQLLEGEGSSGKYRLDANAELTVEELGMQRKVESFSAGCQDLMGVCLRLAFIDVMYTEERPVIILDDPFVNLDQEKTERAKKLLQNASKRYQILYLTCNKNRMW